jgi:hypothetical protein
MSAMTSMTSIVNILFAGLLFWGVGQAVVHRFLSVDETTLAVFKLMLRHRGIDLGNIPDAALIDMVVLRSGEAKQKAIMADARKGGADDWQRYLFRLLDEQADLVERTMRDASQLDFGSETARILLKYGVLEPPYPPALSVEEFIDAAKRGTLFAELEERISKREFC